MHSISFGNVCRKWTRNVSHSPSGCIIRMTRRFLRVSCRNIVIAFLRVNGTPAANSLGCISVLIATW